MEGATYDTLVSMLRAAPTVAAAPAALTTGQAIANVNAFAFSLFNQLARTNRDVFISPVSIVAALGMLMAATTPNGTVEKELKKMLKCGEKDISGLLDNVFTGTKSDKMQLLMANSVWTSKVKKGFKAQVSKDFKAEVRPIPSSPDPINKWVNQSTAGMIPKLVNDVPNNAMALILNAIFFKGAWTHPFNPKLTKSNVPFRQSWSKVKKHVKMMSMVREEFFYGEARLKAGKLRIIEMPYGHKQAYSAVVALPVGKATLDDAVAGIGNWNNWMRNLSSTPVKVDYLGLPRFKLEYGQTDVKDALIKLGVKSAFSPSGEPRKFTRMSDVKGLFVDQVIHKTALEVTEEGTKAAAVTELTVSGSSHTARRMYVDSPFLFAIRNRKSGLLLFLGRVDDPKDV